MGKSRDGELLNVVHDAAYVWVGGVFFAGGQ
jgi:hypothetical protein